MSQTEIIFSFLCAHIEQEVPMPVLADLAGSYAVNSRVSDIRKRGHKVTNRIEVDKKTGVRKSFYTLHPLKA